MQIRAFSPAQEGTRAVVAQACPPPASGLPEDTATISLDAAARALLKKSAQESTCPVAWRQGQTGLGAPALTSRGPCVVEGSAVLCYDSEGGAQWTYTADAALSPPAAAPGGAATYVCSDKGELIAVDDRGGRLWAVDLPVTGANPPAVAPNGRIFVAGKDGKVHAVSPDGKKLWSKKIKPWLDLDSSPDVFGRPVATPDDGVVVANCKKYLVKLDGDGHKSWRRRVRGEITQDPAVDPQGNVAYGAYFSTLVVLDRKGREKWTHEMPGRISASPGFGPDGSVCAADDHGLVVRLDEDGRPLAEFQADERVVAQPLVAADGTMFVSTWLNSTVYAVPPAGGAEKWKAQLGGLSVSAGRLAGDGTLYMTSVGGSLVALRDRPPTPSVRETLDEAVAASAAPAAPPPHVETVDGWVVIGGVRVPMRTAVPTGQANPAAKP